MEDELKAKRLERIHIIIFGLAILVFIGMKSTLLNLPYYWDEAWSYARAVNEMNAHQITLLPSQVNQEIFRGHPLFFYFLTSSMARLGSMNPFYMHCWMLGISILGLIISFYMSKKLFNSSIALVFILLCMFQEAFIVQSSFLLPEIMIAFLGFFCFYFYLQRKFWLYLLVGALLVLTKESGFVAILAICAHAFLSIAFVQKDRIKKLTHLLIWSTPLFVFGAFLLLQKLKWGWYLFPAHTDLMTFSWEVIKARLTAFRNFLFVEQGRIYISIACVLSLVGLLIFKRRNLIELLTRPSTGLFFIFFILYIAFSVVNFYSARYLLALFPFIFLFFAQIFSALISSSKINTAFAVLGSIFYILFFYFVPNVDLGDVSKNYSKVALTQSNMFDEFMIRNKEATFGCDFLTSVNMKEASAGYLKGHPPLKNVSVDEAEYVIATCIEPMNEKIESMQKDSLLILVYENNQEPAWCKIYKRNR